jgi:plastocyanin
MPMTRATRVLAVAATIQALALLGATPRVGRVDARMTITGSVRYAGSAPSASPVDMSADAYCAEAQSGARATIRAIDADAQGRLRNAIVYVKEPSAAQRPAAPSETAVLDQRGCVYVPHVVVLRTGQTLVVRNSDATLHNVHVTASRNRGFNIGQPIRGLESKRTFDRPEVGIQVACDIHGWMNGAIAVFDHPWFAVTGEDGTFSLDGLPPGDYTLEVWHETLGTQTRQVTVGAGGATADFTYPAR